jgi:hypothetical protein
MHHHFDSLKGCKIIVNRSKFWNRISKKQKFEDFMNIFEKGCLCVFHSQIWRNKWEFVGVVEFQLLKWSKKTNLCGKYCDLILRERSKNSSRVNEENVVEEIEVIEFRQRFKWTRFGGSCDGNWFNLLLLIHSLFKWRNDEISSGNSVNWLYDKLRNWSWVSLLIWWEMCVNWWLKLRAKYVRFERQYNSDEMKESLLLFNERCLSFVIIHTSDGIVSMLSVFNTNTSSLIQFFILNGSVLIIPPNINTLKFVKWSNSVGILLSE